MKYYRKVFFFLLLLAIGFSACKKESPVEDNDTFKTFSFSSEKCTSIPDDGFLVLGISTLAKIDLNGNLVWKLNKSTEDYVYSLMNGEIIGCEGYDQNNYINKFITITKYDKQGNLLKTKKLYMSDSLKIVNPKVVELSSGDLLFFGIKGLTLSNNDSVLLIIKTDKNLNPLWTKKLNIGSKLLEINKLVETNLNGDVILIGNTVKIFGINSLYYASVDSSGSLIWQKENSLGYWENYTNDIQKINSHEFIITGSFDQAGVNDNNYNFQFFALKINELGNSIGFFVSGSTKQDYCMASVLNPSNNDLVMIGMEGRSNDDNDLNFSGMKILTLNSSLSTVISDNIYAKLQSCTGIGAAFNSDGSLSVIGKKNAFENKNLQNTFFLKIKPDGSF